MEFVRYNQTLGRLQLHHGADHGSEPGRRRHDLSVHRHPTPTRKPKSSLSRLRPARGTRSAPGPATRQLPVCPATSATLNGDKTGDGHLRARVQPRVQPGGPGERGSAGPAPRRWSPARPAHQATGGTRTPGAGIVRWKRQLAWPRAALDMNVTANLSASAESGTDALVRHGDPAARPPAPSRQGSSVSVAWTVTYAGSTGQFHTYAEKDGTYYWLDSRAASGAGSYGFSWLVTQPQRTGGYELHLARRTAAAAGWSRTTPARRLPSPRGRCRCPR